MKARPFTGSSLRFDTGPPTPENVGPAGDEPGGPHRTISTINDDGNNLRERSSRQAYRLLAVIHIPGTQVCNHICARKEGDA